MKSIYGKSTRYLMRDFVSSDKVKKSDKFNRQRIRNWFQKNYPKIKVGTIDAHITIMTINAPSRLHHIVHEDGSDDLFIQLEDGQLRLFDKNNDPTPIYKKNKAENNIGYLDEEEITYEQGQEFAYENDLKNFLSKNLHIIE